MARLIVRNVEDQIVRALKLRAAAHGRSREAEHRAILETALLNDSKSKENFAKRAARLRRRLRSNIDSTALIRADRDRYLL